jgi:uncharacterized membrane protein
MLSPQPLQARWLSFTHAAVLLALFGLIVTTVPLLSQLLGVPVICGPFTDCNRVLTDPASRIAGVPIAMFGFVVFATALFLSTQVARSRRMVSILLGLSLGTFVISGLLQWAVYRRLGLACPWCLGAAAAAVMLAVTAGLMRWRDRTRQPVRPAVLWVGSALAALFVAGELAMMLQAR